MEAWHAACPSGLDRPCTPAMKDPFTQPGTLRVKVRIRESLNPSPSGLTTTHTFAVRVDGGRSVSLGRAWTHCQPRSPLLRIPRPGEVTDRRPDL